ncbi:hypothetical protein ACFUMI_37990 [Streptomyces sp. NPDC057273]|uniref:hypothetical protein n=1 Tax=Streptomyces sp. NPDC057273 TaxID=3346080 RepID=UPI003625BBB5
MSPAGARAFPSTGGTTISGPEVTTSDSAESTDRTDTPSDTDGASELTTDDASDGITYDPTESSDRTDATSDTDIASGFTTDASGATANDSADSPDRTDAVSDTSDAVSDERPSGTLRRTVSGAPPAGAGVPAVPASAVAVAGTPSPDDTGTPVPVPVPVPASATGASDESADETCEATDPASELCPPGVSPGTTTVSGAPVPDVLTGGSPPAPTPGTSLATTVSTAVTVSTVTSIPFGPPPLPWPAGVCALGATDRCAWPVAPVAPPPPPGGVKPVLTWTYLLLNARGTFTGLIFNGVIRCAAARAPPAAPNARPEVTMCHVTWPASCPVASF